jgi:hypothetical protein
MAVRPNPFRRIGGTPFGHVNGATHPFCVVAIVKGGLCGLSTFEEIAAERIQVAA